MRPKFLPIALLVGVLSSLVAGSKHILPLKRTGLQTPSSHALVSKCSNSTHLMRMIKGAYSVPIQFGKDTFNVLFDTGASDMWLASSSFKCMNRTSLDVLIDLPQEQCRLGPLVQGNFSGGTTDQTLRVPYRSGQLVSGKFGYEDITFAGITVKHQMVCLADIVAWKGNGEISGLLGFGYPGGTEAIKSGHDTFTHYNPFFWNAVKQERVKPMFSLALSREGDGNSSQLALGCLPDVEYKGDFISIPLQKFDLPVEHGVGDIRSQPGTEGKNFTLYRITLDEYIVGAAAAGKGSLGELDVIVDSGAALNFLPVAIAEQVNKLFTPPAQFDQKWNQYHVACDATSPTFGVRIAGKVFLINGQDLISHTPFLPTGRCLSGVQSSRDGPNILGVPFLKNVVAVFDIGRNEMRFAAR